MSYNIHTAQPFKGFGTIQECILLAQILTMAEKYCGTEFSLEINYKGGLVYFNLAGEPWGEGPTPYLWEQMTLQQLHAELMEALQGD